MVSNSLCACFNWQAVQATYRLEETVNDQGRALELKRDKCLDATRTLKNSEGDLLKVREELLGRSLESKGGSEGDDKG